MNQSLQPLKGFRDFLPKEMFQRNWLKNKIIKTFELWGFEAMESPTLEPLSLFQGQIGEDEKLFYSFTDNGERQVAMRYDQTVPTCRVLGRYANELPYPYRRHQIQSVFRAEKPQAGRYREFIQCDADIFGSPTPQTDAELIALSLDIYKRLGFPQAIAHINDRSLLSNIPYTAISSIDKLDKISSEEVIQDMVNKNISESQAQEYLTYIKNLQPNNTIQIILEYLINYGFETTWFQFDPTIARSFSYSEGPIWEIKIPGFDQGTVLGGERYDGLVQKITGQAISGTGFGLGFDRTLEAAIQFNLVPEYHTKTQVLVACLNSESFDYAIKCSSEFRSKNLSVELYPNPETKLGNQIKYALKKNIPILTIVGPDEKQNNTLTIKILKDQSQSTIPFIESISIIQNYL